MDFLTREPKEIIIFFKKKTKKNKVTMSREEVYFQ